jgi:hypothetical protein
MGHEAAPEPSLAMWWVRSCGTRGSVGARPSGRRGPESLDMWQHRNLPEQGGRIQSPWISGDTRALPSGEAGSRATGHVEAI